MNYRDVYFSRVNYFGETQAERIKNNGILQFERWMAQSPFTVTDLSIERGLYFSGIIETSKDKEAKKLMYLHVANDIPLQVGDILTWRQDNGVIEKWLLLQKIHKVHETYQTFQMVKCNYNLKWIDTKGYLHQSWAYAVSSVDSMVKGNFRMWHSLISPQPNKFAEIIMPRPELAFEEDREQLMRGINFIIENEAWIVVECDWTSVEGVIYMSLTESKVNYHYDNTIIDVADTDRYKFPELPAQYKVGEVIVPQFEADTLNQWEIELRPSDFTLFSEKEEQSGEKEKWYSELHSIADGQCIITMRLKNNPAVTETVEIIISPIEQEQVLWIEGPDELRLGRQASYSLATNTAIEDLSKVEIKIQSRPEKDEETKIRKEGNNNFIVQANAKNKLGKLVLVASYDDEECATKTVEIIPLW